MNQQINQKLDWKPNAKLAALPTITADDHRYGMRHFAIGVTIITARDGDAKAGLTATAVCSVTADPPRLVVFVNKNVVACDMIMKSGALCVNVLSGEQEDVAKAFAGMIKDVHGDARFQYGVWQELVSGAPALEGTLASFIQAHAASRSEIWVVDPNRGNRAAFHKQMARLGFARHEQVLDQPAHEGIAAYKGRMLTYTRS